MCTYLYAAFSLKTGVEKGLGAAEADGPLPIDPVTDGPLQVRGNMEIISGTGRGVARAESARLCRCGGSN
jgi:hypothetical protein